MPPDSCPFCDHDLYSVRYCPGCGAYVPPPSNIADSPCPICEGEPASDPRFEALFEPDEGLDYDEDEYDRYKASLAAYQCFDRRQASLGSTTTLNPRLLTRKIPRPANGANQYLVFDIEIAKDLGEQISEWRRYRPLGITCAATLTSNGELALWHGRTTAGDFAGQMSQAEASELVRFLENQVAGGKILLTWNGLGFDLNVLAEESGLLESCRELALHHVDMMFHIFCLKGYGLALDKAARGMGLPGKPAGMAAEMAPALWKQGGYQLVLHYVSQDVRMTLDLAEIVEQARQLCWISNRGNPQSVWMPHGWMRVCEAMLLPCPDSSWMDKPWPRSQFTDWLGLQPKSRQIRDSSIAEVSRKGWWRKVCDFFD